MEEKEISISTNGKQEYFNKFILLGKIGQLYVDDRKMIKQLVKQLNRERKGLKSTCYPLSESDRRDIAIALTELTDILNGFLHPGELERFNISVQSLKGYISKLECEINPCTVGSVAKKAIDVAKDTAKNLSEKIGKSVEDLKKTVQGISSK